jgi:hypothetical protein
VGKLAEAAMAKLDAERAETLRALLPLEDEDCPVHVEWNGSRRNVGNMLRVYVSHSLDHYQHLMRLLQARGMKFREAQLLLMKVQAAHAELQALVLSLTDEEFTATGPVEGDWSAGQIVDHLLQAERDYREAILGAVHEARKQRAGR